MPQFEQDHSVTIDQSDALAWRHLMRATDRDLNDSIMAAWTAWKEREAKNGRASRNTQVDAGRDIDTGRIAMELLQSEQSN